MPETNDQPASGYMYTAAQAQTKRVEYLKKTLIPKVAVKFREAPAVKSALLCVGQYWNDEAEDAVHGLVIFSEFDEPDFAGALNGYRDGIEPGADPNLPTAQISREYGSPFASSISTWALGAGWDDNYHAIPLWAAFAPENGTQEYDRFQEVYAPAVLIRRDGSFEFFDMVRPWLDGVRPSEAED